MPSFDILIPSFNYGNYLGDCIRSVLAQGVEELRILVVDNASTDGSVQIARQFAAKDPRIEVRARERNLGPTRSFNDGVDWAEADYFMILCADDMLTQGSLARAASIMEHHADIAFVYGEDVHLHSAAPLQCPGPIDADPQWRIVNGSEFIRERCRNPEHYIAAGMVLVRTAAHKAAGHYRPELPHTDDFEMLLRLACFGRVAHTQAIQGIKRLHDTNRTHGYLADRTSDLIERVAAIESFFAHEGRALSEASRLRRLALDSVAERAYWCGVGDLCRRRPGTWKLFKLAFTLSPMTAVFPPFNYLLRMRRPVSRIRSILSETTNFRGASSRPRDRAS